MSCRSVISIHRRLDGDADIFFKQVAIGHQRQRGGADPGLVIFGVDITLRDGLSWIAVSFTLVGVRREVEREPVHGHDLIGRAGLRVAWIPASVTGHRHADVG